MLCRARGCDAEGLQPPERAVGQAAGGRGQAGMENNGRKCAGPSVQAGLGEDGERGEVDPCELVVLSWL